MSDTRQLEMKIHSTVDKFSLSFAEVHKKIDELEKKLNALEKILISDGK